MAGAPDPNCGIIAGSSAELFIAQEPVPIAPATGDIVWVKVGDLDNFTFARDSTDTSLNSAGWIRTLPMERGMTITATGRVNTVDEGQQEVEDAAFGISCDALRFWRFYVPGAHVEDPPYRNIGFWAWANMQDVSAGTTDPFSWGVELRVWSQPVELDEQNQPLLEATGSDTAVRAQPGQTPAQAQATAQQPHRRGAGQEPATPAGTGSVAA